MTDGLLTDETPAGPASTPVTPTVDLALPLCLVVAVVAGGGLAAAAEAGALALLVAVAVVQAALAFGWVFGTGMPGRKGAIVVAALAAAGADITTSVWPHGRLGTLLAVLGLAVPVMFVHQLSRGAARVAIVSSLSAVAALVVGEVSFAALLQIRHEFVPPHLGGRVAVAVIGSAAAALVVGYLIDMIVPMPRFDPAVPRGIVALIGSAAVGAAVAYLVLRDEAGFDDGGRAVFLGAAVGALAGLLAVAAAFVQHTTPPPAAVIGRLMRPVFAVLLPLAVLAPAGFLLCLAVRS